MKQLKGYNSEAVRGMEREALDKYKNMSEDALVDALMSQVRKSKSDGRGHLAARRARGLFGFARKGKANVSVCFGYRRRGGRA